MLRRLAFVGLVTSSLLLGACGSVSSTVPITSDRPRVSINIVDAQFTPSKLTVKPGTIITWTNFDSMQHSVQGDANPITSPVLNRNDTFSYTFDSAGTYRYHCGIHPSMSGVVTVSE